MHHISGKLFVLTKGHLYVSATNIRIINTMSITRSKIKRGNLLLSCFVDQILLKVQSLKNHFSPIQESLVYTKKGYFQLTAFLKAKKLVRLLGVAIEIIIWQLPHFLHLKLKKNKILQ